MAEINENEMNEVPAEEAVVVAEPEEAVHEESVDISSGSEDVAAPVEEPAAEQPIVVNPFVSEERRASMEAKFSDLRFGRNAKK